MQHLPAFPESAPPDACEVGKRCGGDMALAVVGVVVGLAVAAGLGWRIIALLV